MVLPSRFDTSHSLGYGEAQRRDPHVPSFSAAVEVRHLSKKREMGQDVGPDLSDS